MKSSKTICWPVLLSTVSLTTLTPSPFMERAIANASAERRSLAQPRPCPLTLKRRNQLCHTLSVNYILLTRVGHFFKHGRVTFSNTPPPFSQTRSSCSKWPT
jgi:hypothetical protein